MSTFKQILTFAYESEYESAYDLSTKKLFSSPKIYTANGNLSKRWYVYFSFRDPNTGKLKRLTPFYGTANTYKTKEERMEVLTVYRKVLLKLLKQGYNPFKDNTALYQKLQGKTITTPSTTEESTQQKEAKQSLNQPREVPNLSLRAAFDYGLKLKEKLVGVRTLKAYRNKIDLLLKWLDKNHPNIKTIDALNKQLVLQFLNHVLDKTSPRNRNNYRADLGSIMQVLEDNEVIGQNYVKNIPILKSKPERNKTYTLETQEAIFKHLKEKDPILLLYIKFISYGFMRPIEVCRLKVGNINLQSKTLQFKAKNSQFKTKIIPQILLDDLPDLSKLNPEHTLFTPNKIGGEWETNETNKRDYFSKRFKKVVKDHFKLGKDYGLYSFRHTYITKVYRALVMEYAPFEAKSKLMLITGHTSMNALEKYLRDIDAELPPDFSEMLKKKQ
ncbi:Site-specific recombinase XerD [Flaviramulus basaltis]|uniref:Site-specific recombinase XerD n=1 Tax=Flaviramulus basaltis TaxID=369401 RepID=A0A1K2IGG1_9FLAO|nr:site-specific integrase [Flaviramulus basaltis]SFZ91336.1 Site-specific recombinase XerD [Flaviramulus basaltis]